MKKFLLPSLIVVALISMSLVPKTNSSESYAIVSVIEKSSRLIIRTTIDDQPSTAVNIKPGYAGKEDMTEFSPVTQELKKLNEMGYTLVSSSSSILIEMASSSKPYHTFVLRKTN